MTIMTATIQIANRCRITGLTFDDWLPEGHQAS
jgi:hypothetical protein